MKQLSSYRPRICSSPYSISQGQPQGPLSLGNYVLTQWKGWEPQRYTPCQDVDGIGLKEGSSPKTPSQNSGRLKGPRNLKILNSELGWTSESPLTSGIHTRKSGLPVLLPDSWIVEWSSSIPGRICYLLSLSHLKWHWFFSRILGNGHCYIWDSYLPVMSSKIGQFSTY